MVQRSVMSFFKFANCSALGRECRFKHLFRTSHARLLLRPYTLQKHCQWHPKPLYRQSTLFGPNSNSEPSVHVILGEVETRTCDLSDSTFADRHYLLGESDDGSVFPALLEKWAGGGLSLWRAGYVSTILPSKRIVKATSTRDVRDSWTAGRFTLSHHLLLTWLSDTRYTRYGTSSSNDL